MISSFAKRILARHIALRNTPRCQVTSRNSFNSRKIDNKAYEKPTKVNTPSFVFQTQPNNWIPSVCMQVHRPYLEKDNTLLCQFSIKQKLEQSQSTKTYSTIHSLQEHLANHPYPQTSIATTLAHNANLQRCQLWMGQGHTIKRKSPQIF